MTDIELRDLVDLEVAFCAYTDVLRRFSYVDSEVGFLLAQRIRECPLRAHLEAARYFAESKASDSIVAAIVDLLDGSSPLSGDAVRSLVVFGSRVGSHLIDKIRVSVSAN